MQAYSLRHSRLLDSSHVHPSPPTCLALSPSSHILVSASAIPPTVYVQQLAPRSSPISLRPAASSVEVTAAAFHPRRANIFALGFADGTLALYDTTRLFRDGGKRERGSVAASTGQSGEVAYLRNVHLREEIRRESRIRGERSSHEPFAEISDDGHARDDTCSRVVGLDFLPGFQARVVTLSVGGRCTISDLAKPSSKQGRFINSWIACAEATSLAVLGELGAATVTASSSRVSTAPTTNSSPNDVLVAIGSVDGDVRIFDINGVAHAERVMGPERSRILDVEWIAGPGPARSNQGRTRQTVAAPLEPDRPAPRPRLDKPKSRPLHKGKRKSLSALLAAGRQVEEVVVASDHLENPPQAPSSNDKTSGDHSVQAFHHSPRAWQDIGPPSPILIGTVFSPVSANRRHWRPTSFPERRRSRPRGAGDPFGDGDEIDAKSSVSAPQLWEDPEPEPAAAPAARAAVPAARPVTGRRKSRRISLRTAQTHEARSKPRNDASLLAGLRVMGQTGGSQGSGGGLALFAPYIQKKKPVLHASSPSQSTAGATVGTSTASPAAFEACTETDLWLSAAQIEGGTLVGPASRKIPVRKSSRNSCKDGSSAGHTASTARSRGGSTTNEGRGRQRQKNVSFDGPVHAAGAADGVLRSGAVAAGDAGNISTVPRETQSNEHLQRELLVLRHEMAEMRTLHTELQRRCDAQDRALASVMRAAGLDDVGGV